MAEVINGILIREVETKNIMTKSSLPVGGYSVNPYDRDKVFLHKHRNAECVCLIRQRPCPSRLRMNLPALSSGHGADNDPIDSGKVNCAGIVEKRQSKTLPCYL